MLKSPLDSWTLAARLVAPEGEWAAPPHRVMLADATPKEDRRLGAHSATIMTASHTLASSSASGEKTRLPSQPCLFLWRQLHL